MKEGVRGEAYNAGSGTAVSMAHVLDLLRAECPVPVEVVTRPERLRPTEIAVLVANCAKLRTATGWTPRIPLRQTLRDTLDFWREREAEARPPSA
jgi:GDP-4-dehydro-6-deoxy-D-mannose reductase